LDTDVYRPVPKSTAKALLGLDPGKRHVLFSALNSRGDHNKGVSDLTPVREAIRADAMLRDVELVALGRREDKDACGVRWLGKMRDDITMALAYSAADTLVMLSRSENLPYTVAEAMACGTPCVAYDVGGIGELVTPGEHGLLAHPFVVEELARAVVEVLRWEESRGTAERCRDKIMNMCGAERIAHEYTTLYQTLIERSARKLVVSCR